MIKNNPEDQAVEILRMNMTTDCKETFTDFMNLAGYDMTKKSSEKLWKETGITPDQIQVGVD